jgi:ABC-type transporter Mla MlaB component
MLRIITEQRGPTIRLELHGTIAGEWIDVLHRHWRELLASQPEARVAVGLSNVAFIDNAGEALLRHMAETGVEFDGAGLMNRYVIERICGGL